LLCCLLISVHSFLILCYKREAEIHKLSFVNEITPVFSLSVDIKMKFSFPNNYCYTKYNKSAFDETTYKNHPAGNFLSTVIQIYNDHWKIIFTADSVFEVFQKLNQLITGDKPNLCFVQVSHHGAKSNFNKDFWAVLQSKFELCKGCYLIWRQFIRSPFPITLERYGYKIYATNLYSKQAPSTSFRSALNIISKKKRLKQVCREKM
jgi:hypothetical protein